MKYLVLIGILIYSFNVKSQNNDVLFFEKNLNNTLNFYVVNTTKTKQEVELQIVNSKGLRGDKKPQTKEIAPRDTLLFYTFSIIGAYSYNYNIKATPLFEIEQVSSDLETNFDKGVVIFFKPDCPRSQRTLSYLIENDIEFKILNVTENKDYPVLMMQLLKEKRKSSKQLLYPVVLVNGEVYFNFDIPQSFQNIFKDF